MEMWWKIKEERKSRKWYMDYRPPAVNRQREYTDTAAAHIRVHIHKQNCKSTEDHKSIPEPEYMNRLTVSLSLYFLHTQRYSSDMDK